jgi:hypothetical protein
LDAAREAGKVIQVTQRMAIDRLLICGNDFAASENPWRAGLA